MNESRPTKAKTVERLLQNLREHDWSVNWKMADALAQEGRNAFPHLLQALEDPDGYVRNGAAIALGKIGNDEATEPLIRALRWHDDRLYDDDEDHEARMSAATALGRLRNDEACQALISELDKSLHGNSSLASYIAEALGEIGDPKAASSLAKAIRSGDFELIKIASWALTKLGKEGVEELLKIAANQDQPGRAYVIGALGNNAVKPATSLLLQILEEPDADRFVRGQALEALGRIGESPKIFPILLAMLQAPEEEVRSGALRGLGALHDARAYEPIVEQLNSERHTYTAIMALGELGDPRACDLLMAMLKGKDEGSALHAATALGKIGCPGALPLLTQLRDRMADSQSPVLKAHKISVEGAIQKLQQRQQSPPD